MNNQQEERYPYLYENAEEVIYGGVVPLLEASDIELQDMLDKMATQYKEKIEKHFEGFIDYVGEILEDDLDAMQPTDAVDEFDMPSPYQVEEFENALSLIMLRTIPFNHDVILLANESAEKLNIETTLTYMSLHNNEIFSTLRKKIMRSLAVI